MKTKVRFSLAALIFVMLLGSCTKNAGTLDNVSLKQSINQSAMNLNTAMNQISSSDAYSILTVASDGTKSATIDSIYKVYIPLDLIKGVYNYKPSVFTR